MYVFTGASDGEAASLVRKCVWNLHGALRVQLRVASLVGESFEIHLTKCVISSTGQLLCHPVHGSGQGEGGSCPESGGDS